MKKVLITLPNSIAGTLILNGFANGFLKNGFEVLIKDLRELKIIDIQHFEPDIIFGYDYGFLFYKNNELNNYIIANHDKFKLVNYFADVPDENFACVNNENIYNEYQKLSKFLNITNFIWDKDYTNSIENSIYLPLGINEELYKTENNRKKYDISFVGRPLTNIRQELLSEIVKSYGSKLNIFCFEKHFQKSIEEIQAKNLLSSEELETYKNCYKGFLRTERELAKVYNESLININITLQGTSNLNYRVFEVLASKSFLLTDNKKDLYSYFDVTQELDIYTSKEDLVEKIGYYLDNPNITRNIADKGFANINKNHSYKIRVKEILNYV